MTQAPTEHEHIGMLPYSKVVTIVETKNELDQATAALVGAGFAGNDLSIHHGEQGKEFLDPDGEHHGFLFKLRRKYQRLQGTEKRLLDGADDALKAGHYLLGVQIDGSEELQVKARDAILPFTKHSIYFCGQFTITILRLEES